MDFSTLVLRLVLGTGVGKVLNVVFASLFAGGEKIEGWPRSRWLANIFVQGGIMNFCWWRAFTESSAHYNGFATWADKAQWFFASETELAMKGLKWESWYMVVLFTAQSRDMLPFPSNGSKSLFWHHVGVMLTSFFAFYLSGAFNIFAFTSWLLELGSMWFNLHAVYPKSSFLNMMYQSMMLLSNIAGFVLGSWFVLNDTGRPQMWARVVYGAITIAVVIGRQHHALRDAGWVRSHAKPA